MFRLMNRLMQTSQDMMFINLLAHLLSCHTFESLLSLSLSLQDFSPKQLTLFKHAAEIERARSPNGGLPAHCIQHIDGRPIKRMVGLYHEI